MRSKNNKNTEALIVGFLIWVLGVIAVTFFSKFDIFLIIAIPVTFLVIPAIFLLTKFHLRNVEDKEKEKVATEFGIIITLIQFPLDALWWFLSSKINSPVPRDVSTMIAILLPIGYFWLLAVPWWIGKKHGASALKT